MEPVHQGVEIFMATNEEVSYQNDFEHTDRVILALEDYWHTQQSLPQPIVCRLRTLLPLFLGKPYQWEALGEGRTGRYSQEPLYRFDAFDCVTLVNTLLALVYSGNMATFEKNLQAIRYANNTIAYTQRTDWFTDLEWNVRAQSLGWLHDVTKSFVDEKGNSIFKLADTIIDKPGWYAARSLSDLHLDSTMSVAEKAKRLTALRAEGQAFVPQKSQLPYIPFSGFLADNGQLKVSFWAQMPAASIVEIVRPNWPIKDDWIDPQGSARGYGTNLNISHVGIALKEAETGKISFYHASRIGEKVVQVDLTDYLSAYCEHDTIKGIHIETLLEK